MIHPLDECGSLVQTAWTVFRVGNAAGIADRTIDDIALQFLDFSLEIVWNFGDSALGLMSLPNLIALVLALAGLVTPVIAAILMPLSSIGVVGLTAWRLAERRQTWMSCSFAGAACLRAWHRTILCLS